MPWAELIGYLESQGDEVVGGESPGERVTAQGHRYVRSQVGYNHDWSPKYIWCRF